MSGSKTGKGFYKKLKTAGNLKISLDFDSMEYVEQKSQF